MLLDEDDVVSRRINRKFATYQVRLVAAKALMFVALGIAALILAFRL